MRKHHHHHHQGFSLYTNLLRLTDFLYMQNYLVIMYTERFHHDDDADDDDDDDACASKHVRV